MVLGLPQGMPGGYVSIQDFLTDHRLSTRSMVYSATGGDYPADLEARLIPADLPPVTRDIFAMGLYDFIRTTHGRARLDSVLETIGKRVGPSQGTFKPGQSLVYRLDRQGLPALLLPDGAGDPAALLVPGPGELAAVADVRLPAS